MILLIFLLFWFLSIAAGSLYYTSLWQTKEYRFDRFFDQMKTKGGFLTFFPLEWAILLIFLLLGLTISTNEQFFPYFSYSLLAVYGLKTTQTLYQIIKKTIRRPKLTKKAILISFGSFILALLPIIWLYIQQKPDIQIFVSAVGVDVLMPFIVSLVVVIFKPITAVLKKRIMAKARDYMKQRPDLIIIGITGSYGKTSTKEFLHSVLATKFHVKATPERVNSEIGVAQWILQGIPQNTEVLIVEMGAYKKGEIKAICDIVSPQIGIVTGINEQHLSLFGSLENTVEAKGELVRALPEEGLAIINGDNEYCLKMKPWSKAPVQLYSLHDDKKSIHASNIAIHRHNIAFHIHHKNEEQTCKINILGKHHIANILAVTACALHLGMSLKEIADACAELKSFKRTMEPFDINQHLLCIDDSYNANPDGVYTALEYMQEVQSTKKILVMAYLRELGERAVEIHEEIGKKAGLACDIIIMIDKSFSTNVRDGAYDAGLKPHDFITESHVERIASLIKEHTHEEAVVLFEGRGTEKVLDALK